MKFGVRECADVVLRAKSAQKIGKKIFYKNEPVCYFDTLKTSTFEGAATTVYAKGGRGNARLMSWDGERTVTFTMEDALISPIGLSILTGAGLIEAGDNNKTIIQHITEKVDYNSLEDKSTYDFKQGIWVTQPPHIVANEPTIYVMVLDDHGEVISEPYLFTVATTTTNDVTTPVSNGKTGDEARYKIVPAFDTDFGEAVYGASGNSRVSYEDGKSEFKTPVTGTQIKTYLVDYYTERTTDMMQINITPDKFGGTFYLEASTLWRDQGSGEDLPAEFIIPKCKVQSNFSFTLASSGDPSSFTFTMDAFPDYTRWDPATKVLAAIQVRGGSIDAKKEPYRTETWDSDNTINPTSQIATPTT